MSHLSVSDNESSFELINSSDSSMDHMDSDDDCNPADKYAIEKNKGKDQMKLEIQQTRDIIDFSKKLNGTWKVLSGKDTGCFVSYKLRSSNRITIDHYLADGSVFQSFTHLTPKHIALQQQKGSFEYIDIDQWVLMVDGKKTMVKDFEDGYLRSVCFYGREDPQETRMEKVDGITNSGKSLVVPESTSSPLLMMDNDSNGKDVDLTDKKQPGSGVQSEVDNESSFERIDSSGASSPVEFKDEDLTVSTSTTTSEALAEALTPIPTLEEQNTLLKEENNKLRGMIQPLQMNLEDAKDQKTLLNKVNLHLKKTIEQMQEKLDAKDREDQKDQKDQETKDLEIQENLDIIQFAKKLNGVWKTKTDSFVEFEVLNRDRVNTHCYLPNGKLFYQGFTSLTPKHIAIQNRQGPVQYIDKDQWVTLQNGEKSEVIEFEDGNLKNWRLLNEKVDWFEKVDRVTFLGNDMVVSDDQEHQKKLNNLRNQKTALEKRVTKLRKQVEDLKEEVLDRDAKLQKAETVIQYMRDDKAVLQRKNQDQKHQTISEPLPILQEINGIWKMVSEDLQDSYGSLLGEFLRLEADSERIKLESFKPTGKLYKVVQVLLHTNKVPIKTPQRFDFVENNQWKTVYNSQAYNCVRSIQDGKLVYEYFDKKGNRYIDVYERVEEVPIPVMEEGKTELEEVKDQMKKLEEENLQLKKELEVKDQKTPEPLPILQEINGIWKVVSEELPEYTRSMKGEFLKIEADSKRITMERFKPNGVSYKVEHFQLSYHTKKAPGKSARYDYIENNVWKTIVTTGCFNLMKRIVDGKLVYEYMDRQGRSYKDVYERVEKVPLDQNIQESKTTGLEESQESENPVRERVTFTDCCQIVLGLFLIFLFICVLDLIRAFFRSLFF